MVSLSLSTLGSLGALVQALKKTGSPQAASLEAALVAFEAAARRNPNPAAEWRGLRDELLALERDDPAEAKEVAKLRAACDAELAGLASGPEAATGGVTMVINDPEGAELLEEIEQIKEQTGDLHLTAAVPSAESVTDGSEPSCSAEVPPAAYEPAPLPSLESLPDELLPLLLSAARPPVQSGLSDSALLVTLALYPSLVLPPGKTLLSLFARPSLTSSGAGPAEDTYARKRKRALDEVAMDSLGKRGKGMDGVTKALGMTPEERVAVMMKSAYWDQAADLLLAPPPSTQPTLKIVQLQTDLTDAARTLLPPSTLASLFPVPDADPVGAWDPQAFAGRLDQMLEALRSVCAPIRDAEIDRLQSLLRGPVTQGPAPPANPGESSGAPSPEVVARTRAVIRAVQGILDLSEVLRADLAQAKLAAVPLSALPSMVRALAHAQERNDLLSRWTIDELRSTWRSWTGVDGDGWTKRLADSICSPTAITFLTAPAPSSGDSSQADTNRLPPLLSACAPVLWVSQNLLQALLITSLLVLLAPAAPPDLAGKIFALLRADLLAPPSASHTHLSDLEALLRAGRDLDPEGRKQLRGRIDKILRSEDPVWALLAQRLAAALASALAPVATGAPDTLRTGLVARTTSADGRRRVVVKGFEGATLEEAIGEVLVVVEGVRDWVKEGWADVLHD